MNAPQPVSPRRRMQQLLAIPDRDRSDAEWDELNELEIQLAPGNRDTGGDPAGRARVPGAPGPQRSPGGRPQGQGNKGGHARQSGQPRPQQGQGNGGNSGNVASPGNVQLPAAQNAANPGNAANAGAPAGKKQFRKPRSRPPRPEVV
ncbi:hypothetical protein [Rhodocyclus tenuis]|uniref:hypothetical protein n=1 Tax=Rhodocyclus tenuis TaxID=1066 RepID=UPI0019056AEE|nr:hypothetical protein [Rhodocyclus tenuis]MBK1680929.1 hypothetical protein [Rhodocyclus tenuis]